MCQQSTIQIFIQLKIVKNEFITFPDTTLIDPFFSDRFYKFKKRYIAAMFKEEDISQINARGSQLETVNQQLENFKSGFPFLRLTEAATNYHGIINLSEKEKQGYISSFDYKVANGLTLVKFVPASGAASRMFKSLFAAWDDLKKGKSTAEVLKEKEVDFIYKHLRKFAFYDDLLQIATNHQKSESQLSLQTTLELLLSETGLNYGYLPKGLLKFHKYPEGNRTPLEEHLIEGAAYSKNNEGKVYIHFTVSPEHQSLFEKHVGDLKSDYEKKMGVIFEISFSLQKPSTDTIAVNTDNQLFREQDGSLFFRPAGHGALLENMNDIDSDLIFIKNIDNVIPDWLKAYTTDYKKALAGVLLSVQEQIFYYQKILKENYPNTLESAFYAEAANFLENVLNITPPQNQYYSEKEELYYYFSDKFNRPIRVCGMVKNQGEPGGGPFFAINRDGSVSVQIAENSQINLNDQEQSQIAKNATHFNPVDLVCSVKNFEGIKYNLLDFTDPETGFISIKSKDGKELKVQELPGLWNGSMSDWNTLFVEVPIETFNPVKTVSDLLRKEHQPK